MGDPFGIGALERNLGLLAAAGAVPAPRGLVHYYAVEVRDLFIDSSFVAFGAVNYAFGGHFEWARWIPRVIGLGLLSSAVVREAWRSIRGIPFVILLAGLALFLVAYGYPGYRYRCLQIRYFFNQLPILSLIAAIGLLSLWHSLKRLRPELSDWILPALLYIGLVGLNVLVEGVIGHLGRYVGTSAR